jgi:FkbM family methyltransferase
MIRRRSTDINVFNQIFVGREYECLDEMDNVRLVIDCGANVGFSSVYFLSRHPRCEVIAIEPDAGNFEMLQRNLAPYADRVKLIRAGVWSHTTQLVMAENEYRGGREWSRQVRLCRPDEKADFEAVDIGSLLDGSGYQWISILKIDVEGTEAVIFRENYESWMERTDTIVIELHDDSMFGKGSEVFHSAIEGRDFKISKSGELTVCRSPGRRP